MSTTQSALAVILNIWRQQPLQALYYRSKAMQALIDHTLAKNKFDAVYVHLFRMAPYVANHKDLYRVVDLTDVISQELIRSMPYREFSSKLLYMIERPRIERYERWVATHFEETWLISEHDSAVLAQDCLDANIQVVRNGVDTKKLYPTGEREIPNRLILVGHMGVYHNVDAAAYLAQQILPKVRAEIPDVHLQIVGAAPNPQVQALTSIAGVEVMGYVPDLNAALNQAAVFVAPLRFAAGVQNKVLEAMAAGRPVITTPLVNQGVGAQPDRDLLIAKGSQETANAIIRVLRDEHLRKELGQSARKFVQKKYNWSLVRQRMAQIDSS